MANPEHLKILEMGVEKWNHWREQNPQIQPDLEGADLQGVNLDAADFLGTNLRYTNLKGADLWGANLEYADLKGAHLEGANFGEVRLKGASISQFTTIDSVKGIQQGINGIYCENTDSAALLTFESPREVMISSDAGLIRENLRKARTFLWYSMLLALLALVFPVFSRAALELPFIKDFVVTPQEFLILAIPLSAVLLIMGNTYFEDAYKGCREIHDRRSATAVSNFPWYFSRFAGGSPVKKYMSVFIRFFLAYHPAIYLWIYLRFTFTKIPSVIVLLSILVLMGLSTWTFLAVTKISKADFV